MMRVGYDVQIGQLKIGKQGRDEFNNNIKKNLSYAHFRIIGEKVTLREKEYRCIYLLIEHEI